VLIPIRETDDPTVHAMLAQAFLALGQFDDAINSIAK